MWTFLHFLALVICLNKFGNCENPDTKVTYLFSGFSNNTQSAECVKLLDKIPLNGSVPLWALQMVDFTGKLQSGLLSGNIMSLGDYDACIAIDDPVDNVRGKYCMLSYRAMETVPLIYGICIPEVCNLGAMIPSREKGFYTRDDLCVTSDVNLDFGDVFCILLLVSIAVLVAVATFYDLHNRYQENFEFNKVLMSFSIYTNTIKLMNINPSEISCLYGIRVISMLWIIYGHRASVIMGIPHTNTNDLEKVKYSNAANHIFAANFAVDTFFFLSGFLVAYNTLKNGFKLKLEHVPQYILHRWLRIFPTVAMIFLVLVTIGREVGSGPFYKLGLENARLPCVEHWWSYFLFIQNYVNPEYMCLTQTWYLSADMQMHILSPLVLIPLGALFAEGKMSKIRAMFFGLIAFAMFVPMMIALNGDNSNLYSTHWRIAIYLIGIYTGMRAINIETFTIKWNKKIYWSIWVGVVIVMAMVAWPARHLIHYPNSVFAIMLQTFGRPVWGICMAWIVLNCMSGHSPCINKFLSLPIFEVLSRLTFCMYALHNLEIGFHSISTRQAIYLSEFLVVQTWIADIFVTLFFSYFWTMMFEVPIIQLDKVLFGVHQTPKIKHTQQKI